MNKIKYLVLVVFFKHTYGINWASQVALVVKNLPANAGDMRCRLDPWVGKIP